MKTRGLMLIFLLALLPASAFATSPAPCDGGRFELFNAEYNSSSIQRSKTTVFFEKRLFKIDTLTGDTWILVDVLKDGRDIKYWRKIENRDQFDLKKKK